MPKKLPVDTLTYEEIPKDSIYFLHKLPDEWEYMKLDQQIEWLKHNSFVIKNVGVTPP